MFQSTTEQTLHRELTNTHNSTLGDDVVYSLESEYMGGNSIISVTCIWTWLQKGRRHTGLYLDPNMLFGGCIQLIILGVDPLKLVNLN